MRADTTQTESERSLRDEPHELVVVGAARRRPRAPLDRFVSLLWTATRAAALPHPREWNLPTPHAHLIVPILGHAIRRFDGPDDRSGRWLSGGLLQPVTDRATLRDTSGPSIVVAARFRLTGLAGLLPGPIDALGTAALALDDLLPGFGDELRERIDEAAALDRPQRRLDCLEALLSHRLRAAASADPLIRHAALELAAGARAGAVQRASGCAPATFIARYRAACGLAPKRHASLMRFQAALRGRDDRRPWADVAAAAGYADQAHLTRTFARLAGMTPTQYRAASTFDRHVAWR